jgi:23S rRNA pseudouridine1911/1915/1917 synthase
MSINVLYEDNHVIAVVKPAGVLTQGDSSGERSLMDMVKDYLKEKYGKPGNVFLGLVHRLDKPVSGIVLFGKTSKGASRLSEQFRNHTIQKVYHGVVVGKPKEDKGEIKEQVNKISFFAEGFTNKTDAELLEEIKKATKTRTAELSWEVVKSNGEYSLLKIMPKTGRFHQIRIQMENMGHPIVGDSKYAKDERPLPDKSIALAATAITFKMATEDKEVYLEIPLPESWSIFLE